MNSFPCFQSENKSLLCDENGRNLDTNSNVSRIISSASRIKTKYMYVKKIEEKSDSRNNFLCFENGNSSHYRQETWIEIAKCYE